MKEMQCSEAESTANHPAFSAPGLTRHRAACCVVALAFLLSNPRWLSNVCFQIGFRLQIFAFKSAASPVLFSCFDWVVMGDGPAQRGTNRELSTCLNA